MPSRGGKSRGRAGSNTHSGQGKRDTAQQAAIPTHPGEGSKPGLHESQPKDAASKTDREKRASRYEQARELQLREDAITRLRAQLGQKERECTQIRHLRDELQSRLGRAEEQNEELREQVKQYEAAHFRLVGEESLQPYLRKMIRWAALPVDCTDGERPDTAVEWYWDHIDGEVRFLSECFFPYPAPWDSLPPALREKLARLTPKAQEYIEDKHCDAVFLYEAWIWRTLVDTLFPDVGATEGPLVGEQSEHWAAYARLRRLAAPHLATSEEEDTSWTVRYRIWRNLTVGIIQHVTGDKTRISPDSVANALKNELDPLFCTDHGMTRERLHEVIQCIAQSATAQRADGFQMAPIGSRPLEVLSSFDGRNIQLITTPQLRMRGNYYGCANGLPMIQKYRMTVLTDKPGPPIPVEKDGGVTVSTGTSPEGA
ncbi:uncharacterized protein B0H64DRAFT_463937 [Chaetomium fimeti]|uniref:Uncharacterized protein n=1 Tax=Chaetomium fimeti TaxID=1854472 RepID=A0AAE0HED8_9PEZI|nr:hypothetical protein B0H64DRAFT_463937 [Chaetomium fimeti]